MLDEKLRRLRVVTLYIVSALGRHDFSFRQIIPKKQSIAQITGSVAKLSGLVFVDQAFTVSWGLTGFKGYRPESRPVVATGGVWKCPVIAKCLTSVN